MTIVGFEPIASRCYNLSMNDRNKVITEIIQKVFNTFPHNITKIVDKGITNDVYIVEASKSKVVVRLSPEQNTDQFAKEKWEMEQVNLLGIPTPKVIDIGIYKDTVYQIQEFIKGSHGTDISLNTTQLWSTLGEYTKITHSIPVNGYGDHMTSPGSFVSNRKDFGDYLEYNIASLNSEDKLIQMEILAISLSEKIRKKFESLRSKRFNFGLNHDDISLKNIIINDEEKVFLLDWGSSVLDIIPHVDIMEILESSFHFDDTHKDFIAFLQGYGLSEEQFKEIKPTIDILLLLNATDKLRWAIDTNPGKIDYFKRRILTVLDYLKM
jgi:aminoglycoside phosphotransferase (APT) family kinase protein